MKKVILFICLLSIPLSGFSFGKDDEIKRAQRSLRIGIGASTLGVGVCTAGYIRFIQKDNVLQTRTNTITQQYQDHVITDQEYASQLSSISSQEAALTKQTRRYYFVGGAMIFTGGIFIATSMIHSARAKNITAAIVPSGFYFAYRF